MTGFRPTAGPTRLCPTAAISGLSPDCCTFALSSGLSHKRWVFSRLFGFHPTAEFSLNYSAFLQLLSCSVPAHPTSGFFHNCCVLCANTGVLSDYSALPKFYSFIPHQKILCSAPITLSPIQSGRGHMYLIRIHLPESMLRGRNMSVCSWDWSHEHFLVGPVT